MIMNNKRPLFVTCFCFIPSTHKKEYRQHTWTKSQILIYLVSQVSWEFCHSLIERSVCAREHKGLMSIEAYHVKAYELQRWASPQLHICKGKKKKKILYMWKRRQDSGGGSSSTQETERKIVALVAIQPTNIVTIPLTGYNTKKGLAQTTTEKLKGEKSHFQYYRTGKSTYLLHY